jgi:hypothetical protein
VRKEPLRRRELGISDSILLAEYFPFSCRDATPSNAPIGTMPGKGWFTILRLYGLLNVSVRVTTWLTAAGPWTVMGPNGNFTLDSWLITGL